MADKEPYSADDIKRRKRKFDGSIDNHTPKELDKKNKYFTPEELHVLITKNENWFGVLTAVESMPSGRDKREAFSTLVSVIKGTDLMREKCGDLVTTVESMADGWDKRHSFYTLVSAIKGTDVMDAFSSRIETIFSSLLAVVVDKPDGIEKVDQFRYLVSMIEGTDLMREKYGDLVTVVESMADNYDKCHSFSTLVKAIKGTPLMDAFSSRIQKLKNLIM